MHDVVRRWRAAGHRRAAVVATASTLVLLLSALTLGDEATVGSPPPPAAAAAADDAQAGAGGADGEVVATTAYGLVPVAANTNPRGVRFRMVPGDTQQHIFQVDRGPRWRFLRMTTTSDRRNRLVTAPVRGLQLRVDACSTVWRRARGDDQSGRVFGCQGRQRLLVASGPALRRVPLGGLRAHADLHLRVTVRLPWISGNATQGLQVRLRNTVTTRPPR